MIRSKTLFHSSHHAPRAVVPDSRRSLRGRNSCRLLDWNQTGSESPTTVNFSQPLRVTIRSKTGLFHSSHHAPRAVVPDSRRSLRGRNSCRLLDWKQTGSESPATVNFSQPLRVTIRSKTGLFHSSHHAPRSVVPDSRRSLRGRNSCRLLDWKQTGSESPATVNFSQPLRVMIRSKTGLLLFGRCPAFERNA